MNISPALLWFEQSSTGKAAKKAAGQIGAAAIGNLDSAKRYGLKVLEFPIEKDVQNVTQFYVLGHEHFVSKDNSKTSIVFTLPDKTGSLVDFLMPFKKAKINITRIISRPIIGKPDEYLTL